MSFVCKKVVGTGINIFAARVLDPIRQELGLEKLNVQILRRSCATRAIGERQGMLKDVQKQLRHTRPDTTLESYGKDIPESVYARTRQLQHPAAAEVAISCNY